jgi:molybdate transport system permease protein
MSWFSVSPVELDALRLSLWVALVAVALSLPLAVAMAYVLARCRFWGHGLLNALVHLPLVLPPVVTGYLLLVVFGRKGALGPVLEALGMQLAFTSAGACAGSSGHGLSVDRAGHPPCFRSGGPAA